MDKKIYTCATAHLDTIWNWDFEHTVSVCIYNTLIDNFRLFEKYPDYKFNFEGSYRYELIKEYYPELFEKLKEYIEKGRWYVTGSAYENGDVNVPSPEALFRNILYGNGYFKKTFGKTSREIYLPDCFGFGYALPSVIRHANLSGFTTQKLTWGSAYGTPFDIGKWYGVDGKWCYSCMKPNEYVATYKNIREKKDIAEKLKTNEEKYGLPWTFSFHGAGDQGGAPKESSVQVLEKEIGENKNSDVKVISSRSDEIYEDLAALPEDMQNKLPAWNNELVMRDHGAGGYTSRAIGKRWNRRNEELADTTERTAVTAYFLGQEYPEKLLEAAWKRVIAHQFHDDLPGTSVQRAYRRSWNDYVLSLNQFENEYVHSMGVLAKALDTSWVKGKCFVVNNPLEFERTDTVKFRVKLENGKYLTAYDKKRKSWPVQIIERNGKTVTAVMFCKLKPVSYKAFDIRETDRELKLDSEVVVTPYTIANENYQVLLNDNGDIAGIRDKIRGKELLKEPIRHELIDYFGSKNWPAWELTYKSICSDKIKYPKLKSIRVLYGGAVTGAIEVVQTSGKSTFKSVISLDAYGDTVKIENEIDWWGQKTLIKDSFELTCSNEYASYDLGLGAISRKNNSSKLFEVPAQKWADITDGDFGVSVLSDSKYGWDKPTDNNLRLTVLHTPVHNYKRQSMQSLMEIGLNRYSVGIHSHDNGLVSTQKSAAVFNKPLFGVFTDKHTGILEDEYSFVSLNKENVILRALKKAEDSDEIIVRFNECANKYTDNIRFSIGNGIERAREVFASEEDKGPAVVENGELIFELDKFEVKSFAVKLKPYGNKIDGAVQKSAELEGNFTLFTENKKGVQKVITDYKELYLPLELKPAEINYRGIKFILNTDKAVKCEKQEIKIDKGFEKLYILAFSEKGDTEAEFRIDGKPITKTIHSGHERIGVWDLYGMKDTANIKECNLAYEFTHAHSESGADVIAKQTFVFCYEFDIKNAEEIQLPGNKDIVVLSAVFAKGVPDAVLSYPMYDRAEKKVFKNNFSISDRIKIKLGKIIFAQPKAKIEKRSDGTTVK